LSPALETNLSLVIDVKLEQDKNRTDIIIKILFLIKIYLKL